MSNSGNPNKLPFQVQAEAFVLPPSDAIVSHTGAAAIAGGAEYEPTVGETTLGQIRVMFREGVIPASRGVQRPPIIHEHPAEHQHMVRIISGWRSEYQPEDATADQVAQRMSTTWVKVAAAQQSPSLMADEDRLHSTLRAFYGDAVHATRDLGLDKGGVRVALYNSRYELYRARELAERSPLLRPSDFKACAAAAPADVLGRTRQTHINFDAVLRAPDQRTLTHHPAVTRSVVSRMALRNPTAEDCVAGVRNYAAQTDELTVKYQNNPLVTPERIRLICSTKGNPEKIIEDTLDLAESLTAQFKGRCGLTEYDIVNVTFRSGNPKKKIEDTIDAIPIVSAQLGGRLTPATVRNLVLTASDPVNEGRKILRRADALKAELAGNTDVQQVLSDRDFVRFAKNQSADAPAAADFARRVVTARNHFANNPHATETIIRRASRDIGGVIKNTNNLVATARRLGTTYAAHDVPAAVIEIATAESSSPDNYVQDFLRTRDNAMRQFGGLLPRGVINDACIRTADSINELGKRMTAYNRARRDPAYTNVSDRDLMRQVCREPVDDGLRPYNTTTIIADMRRFSREHRRGGSRAHIDSSYEPQLEHVRGQLAEWVDDFIPINQGVDQNRVVDRFSRMYYNYIRYGEESDLTQDPQMLRAVFEDYCNYVCELARHGFKNAEAVAQFNSRDQILRQSSEHTVAMRRASNADNLGSLDGDRGLGHKLLLHYPGEVGSGFQDRLDTLSAGERALIEYRLTNQPDATKEQHLRERLRTDELDAYYNGLLRYLQLQ